MITNKSLDAIPEFLREKLCSFPGSVTFAFCFHQNAGLLGKCHVLWPSAGLMRHSPRTENGERNRPEAVISFLSFIQEDLEDGHCSKMGSAANEHVYMTI